jgi:hypothetical protein
MYEIKSVTQQLEGSLGQKFRMPQYCLTEAALLKIEVVPAT